MAPFITRINEIRRRHPAFQRLRNVRFHGSDNDRFLVWSKGGPDEGDTVLVVVNLDPHNAQETVLHLDLGALGVPWQGPFRAHDELAGETYTWDGPTPTCGSTPRRARWPTSSASAAFCQTSRAVERLRSDRTGLAAADQAAQAAVSADGSTPRSARAASDAVERPAGGGPVAPGQGHRHQHAVGLLGPRVDLDRPPGHRLGLVGVAPAHQQLAGPGGGGHEPAAEVLALQHQPLGVGHALVQLAPVQLHRGQVVAERQRRRAVGLGPGRPGHVVVEPVEVDAQPLARSPA